MKKRRLPAALLLFTAVAAAGRASGQQPPFPSPVVSPDRPSFTNGIQLVPAGHLQVEGGLTVKRTGGRTDLGAGELTLRVPLSKGVELRLENFSYAATWAEETAGGTGDPTVDVKWRVLDTEATDAGLIAGTTVPVGSRANGEPHLQPYAILALDQVLGETLSITANAGLVAPSKEGETFGQLMGGLGASLQLSPRVSLFLEGFVWSRTEKEGPGEQVVDAGVQLYATGRLVLDLRAGAGFGRTAVDGFVGLGAAYLF